jgi:hypothetical protein
MAETFSDLPDALVRDLLAKATPVAERVEHRLVSLRQQRDRLQSVARDKQRIRRKADLDVPREPSIVGVDGSYQMHRLTSLDLCAAAAVAVQGTVREDRNRHWPEPYHRLWVEGIPHATESTGMLRAIMIAMELELAALAPHDLILLDGSFASMVIYVNQGLTSVCSSAPAALDNELIRCWNEGHLYNEILRVLRGDRIVAVPKYTSRTELLDSLEVDIGQQVDDKTLATMVLNPGEYTEPLPLHHDQPYHLARSFCTEMQNHELDHAMRALRVIYFRPYGWLPALRLELTATCASSLSRLSIVLEGIQRQFFTPAVIEPYPLFLADRMVKSLGAGVNAVEQVVAQHVARHGVDMELTMLCLHNYRTEGGRGGT